ncbi:hypothetical protein SLS62_011397 [Diatrype stigma]|uniref:Mitochondrial carrier protein n=1 Tax=Diatrype stigma TaxID=117547 RepID=A0AAN9YF49_9PEZI
MSADFWAGYISGAVGILIGNPLDLIKVRLQARGRQGDATSAAASLRSHQTPTYARQHWWSSLVTGTAAPVLGYGALNALLFVSYHRSEAALHSALNLPQQQQPNLWTTWLAGAVGGLATWIVSAPTELVKCRAQLAPASGTASSSWGVAKDVFRREGVRGFYFGGAVTALRDSVGYGFYFWSYELSSKWVEEVARKRDSGGSAFAQDATKVLLCGGLAGVVTWASVFPLDVIKTRVQTQAFGPVADAATPLLLDSHAAPPQRRLGAIDIARNAYRQEGVGVFFRGLGICSVRAFFVNAVQWAVYEWIMLELGQGRHGRATST